MTGLLSTLPVAWFALTLTWQRDQRRCHRPRCQAWDRTLALLPRSGEIWGTFLNPLNFVSPKVTWDFNTYFFWITLCIKYHNVYKVTGMQQGVKNAIVPLSLPPNSQNSQWVLV